MSKNDKAELLKAMKKKVSTYQESQSDNVNSDIDEGEEAYPLNYPELLSYVGGSQSTLSTDRLVNAPEEWNWFSKHDDKTFAGLVESIEQEGLIHPIVVWEQDDGRYMIMSGHNRKRAFEFLYQLTRDPKYTQIPAVIKSKKDFDELRVQKIIVDSNLFQRNGLSTYEKVRSIMFRYNYLVKAKQQDQNHSIGSIISEIAETVGMSKRSVNYYRSLINLIPEFEKMVNGQKVTLMTGLCLSHLSKEDQAELLEKYITVFEDGNLKGLRPHLTFEQVDKILEDSLRKKEHPEEQIKKIEFFVPERYENELRALIAKMINDFVDEESNQALRIRS